MKFFSKLFHNKSIVTLVALVACLVILFFAYRYRVNTAINAIDVPIAEKDLKAREEITEDSLTTMKVAHSMITKNVITNKKDLIGKYVNYNTFIPKGSMFYEGAVVTWKEMPDSAWADIQEGYTIFSLAVNPTTTYGNSIYPGDKIDLYYQNTMNGKLFLGPLIEGIEVLAVKDSNGAHIFKKSSEQRSAAALIFALPDDVFSIMKRASYISGGTIFPVPRNATYDAETVLGNEKILEYINTNSQNLEPDIMEAVDVDSSIKITE
jgi:Flp pilus assembly protein CpaB